MHFRTTNELNLSAARQKILALFLPALGWALLFAGRSVLFHPWCAVIPTPCVVDSVNALDRVVFQFGSIQADFLSNVVQNTAGAIAFILPWILYSTPQIQKSLGEVYILLKASVWTLLSLELCRALVQRPRPLVFHDPMGEGAHVYQYTSFYSGHTSFVAVASLSMFFMVWRRWPRQRWLHINFIILYLCLCIATAGLRVLGGRHYPTDTIFGFIVGSLIAIACNSTGFRKRWTATEPL